MDEDVTARIDYGNVDDESLPINTCICGEQYQNWEFVLSIYREWPTTCGSCGRKFYFRNSVRVFEVIDDLP